MKKRVSVWQLVIWGIVSLLPVFAMVLGTRLLRIGCILNSGIAITYFIIPLAMIIGCLLAMLLPKRKRFKAIWFITVAALCVLMIFPGIMLTVFEKLESYTEEQAAIHYEADSTVFSEMPALTDLGTYQSMEFHNYNWSMMVYFSCDTDTLIATYAPEEYAHEKSMLEARYSFCDAPLTALGHGYSCEPAFQLGEYAFRVVELDREYPKYMMLIATNDSTCEIAYLCFRDYELDYIESLPNQIEDNCGWKYIR